jgi:hypothetical protein
MTRDQWEQYQLMKIRRTLRMWFVTLAVSIVFWSIMGYLIWRSL